MRSITLTLEEAEMARRAALLAAELMCENAEIHEKYGEAEFAEEERADEDRFDALCERLDALIKDTR
jgi:hypothetical protein